MRHVTVGRPYFFMQSPMSFIASIFSKSCVAFSTHFFTESTWSWSHNFSIISERLKQTASNAVARRGPKPRGGFAARTLLGAPPPDPRWGSAPDPAGAPPQTPLGPPAPRPPDGIWGGAPAEVWGRSPQLRTCGEGARGLGAEPPASVR